MNRYAALLAFSFLITSTICATAQNFVRFNSNPTTNTCPGAIVQLPFGNGCGSLYSGEVQPTQTCTVTSLYYGINIYFFNNSRNLGVGQPCFYEACNLATITLVCRSTRRGMRPVSVKAVSQPR